MRYKEKLARNIHLYYIAEFFAELLFIIPVFVAYERQFLTFSQMSLLASGRFAITLLLELPTGAFADLVGRKLSVSLGLIINTIGLLMIAFTNGVTLLVGGIIVRAIGDSFISGSSTALVYDSLKELGREKEFSKVRGNGVLVVQYSIMISSIFAGYMFGIWKGLPYFAYAISTVLSALLYMFMQEPSIDTEKFTFKNYVNQNKQGFKELFKTTEVKNLSLYYALVGGITWAWQIHFNQIYASSIGYNEIEKGWLFAIIRFVNAILIIRLLHLERFVTKQRVFIFFPILIIASAFPAIIQSKPLNTAMLFTMTLASTLRFVILDRYTNELFDSKLRATALSALNLLVGIVYILVVSSFGPILDRFPAYYVLVLVGIITSLFVLPRGIRLSRQAKVLRMAVGKNISYD